MSSTRQLTGSGHFFVFIKPKSAFIRFLVFSVVPLCYFDVQLPGCGRVPNVLSFHAVNVRGTVFNKIDYHYNCWFARDVTAATLVVKNKSISLLWELNSIFM